MTGGATNKGTGINMYANNTAIAQIDITYNILLDFLNVIDFNSDGTGTIEAEVYNNTIDCEGVQYFGLRVKDHANTAKIKNNIFFGTPTANQVYIQTSGATPSVDIDYNLYEIAGDYFNWEGTTDIAFAAWQTAGGDANGLNTDPLFNRPTSPYYDYSLGTASPCMNAGIYLGEAYKDALDSSSTWPDGVVTIEQGGGATVTLY